MSQLTLLDANNSNLTPFRLTKSLVNNGSYMPVVSSPKFDDIVHGRLFMVSEIVTVTTSTNYNIGIEVGSKNIAIVPIISTITDMKVKAYANAIFTGENEFTPQIRNLTISNTCETKVYDAPTVADLGDLILTFFIPTGRFSGSTYTFDQSWVIPANTKFILELDNVGTATRDTGIILEIVELE